MKKLSPDERWNKAGGFVLAGLKEEEAEALFLGKTSGVMSVNMLVAKAIKEEKKILRK